MFLFISQCVSDVFVDDIYSAKALVSLTEINQMLNLVCQTITIDRGYP